MQTPHFMTSHVPLTIVLLSKLPHTMEMRAAVNNNLRHMVWSTIFISPVVSIVIKLY